MFVAGRFILGFGVMIDHGSAPLIVTELAHTQHRATITAVYNSMWYFGSIVAAWVAFGYFLPLTSRVSKRKLTVAEQ